MPIAAPNSKRSLAEADPNAENAPQKRTSARVSDKAQEKENAVAESAEPKGKENEKTVAAAKPKPKPKPKSKGRKKPPMLIAKSGADAYNILKEAREKERVEKAEAKEREKVAKAERKEKEKVEKAKQKEREKAEKAEAKKKEKAERAKDNGKVTAWNADDTHQTTATAKKAAAKSKPWATGETREKMTPLSAELSAEVENQSATVAGQSVNEGKESTAKGTKERAPAGEQGDLEISRILSSAEEGGKSSHIGSKEGAKSSNANFSNGVSESTTTASKTSKNSSKAQDSFEWVCGCRPIFDVEAQYEDSEDEEAAEQADTCGSKRCICDQPAEKHPSHPWIFTKAGKAAFTMWYGEQLRRDQDEHGLYIYNDFSGYGVTEVMENQLVEFDKEFKKKTRSGIALWSQMEGISLFLNGDMQAWCMSDDSERNAKIVALFGTALLSTNDILIQGDLFKEGSSIRNLGLILSLFIGFAEDCCSDLCQEGESDWTKRVVLMAQDHGVEIKGPHGIKEHLQSIRNEIANEKVDGEDEWEDPDDEDGHRKWEKWDWKKEFTAYCREYASSVTGKVGGKHYDITRMSKQEQKKHKLGRR